MAFYGGLDWGGIAHAVCVVDGAGQVVVRIEVGTMVQASSTCLLGCAR